MSFEVPDILVVGAGPAGLAAAIEATEHGASVTVVDENAKPGGQLLKQTHKFFGSERHYAGTRGIDIGAKLIGKANDIGVEIRLDTPVVGIFNGLVVMAIEHERLSAIRPARMIFATGASEKAVSFPGWTLPGVMTAGAAQTFVNVHRVRVGDGVVVVGSGNVGLIVAYQLCQAGGDVVAIVEAMPEIGGWGVHAAKIKRMGIPILTRHTIKECTGNGRVERVVIHQIDERFCPIAETESVLEADTVCLAVGMSPRARLAEMAGCSFIDVPELGGRMPIHGKGMETDIAGCYIAGDIAGIEEASTAIEEGRLAGLAAAFSLGHIGSGVYKERLRAYSDALAKLRSGPFGEERKRVKDDVMKAYEQDKSSKRI